MNEIYIITMNWWQLSLFTIVIAILAVALSESIPRAIKKFLDKIENNKSENKED